jgi:hypothetical protein
MRPASVMRNRIVSAGLLGLPNGPVQVVISNHSGSHNAKLV